MKVKLTATLALSVFPLPVRKESVTPKPTLPAGRPVSGAGFRARGGSFYAFERPSLQENPSFPRKLFAFFQFLFLNLQYNMFCAQMANGPNCGGSWPQEGPFHVRSN